MRLVRSKEWKGLAECGGWNEAVGPCTKSVALVGGDFQCHVCSKSLTSEQGLRSHLFRSHGIKNEKRRHVYGTSCVISLKEFHTRRRSLAHLQALGGKESRCATLVMRHFPPLSDEALASLEAEEKNLEKETRGRLGYTRANLPWKQLYGPLCDFGEEELLPQVEGRGDDPMVVEEESFWQEVG